MTQGSIRELLVHALIVLALTVGGWLVFVHPSVQSVQSFQSEIDAMQAEQPMLGFLDAERIVEPARRLRERIRTIDHRNGLARDSARWYARISSLAITHGLQVHTVRPASSQSRSPDRMMTRSQMDIRVEGGYAAVAQFLDELLMEHGFLRPVSVSLTPTLVNDEPMLTCRFTGEALSFELPENLKALIHDQPAQDVSLTEGANE